MRQASYPDLSAQYENPQDHPCDLQVGQVFLTNGWEKPEGLCQSAWDSMSPFVLDEESQIRHDFLQRRFPAREFSH